MYELVRHILMVYVLYMMTSHIQVEFGIIRVFGGYLDLVTQGHVGAGVALLYNTDMYKVKRVGSICPTYEWRVRDWWNNVSRRVKYIAISFGTKENGRWKKRGKKKRISVSQ